MTIELKHTVAYFTVIIFHKFVIQHIIITISYSGIRIRMLEKMILFIVLLHHLMGTFSLCNASAQKNSSYVSSSSSASTAERKILSYTALTDSNIQLAAYLWVTNNTAAFGTYGDILN